MSYCSSTRKVPANIPDSDEILAFCKKCRETTLEGIRAEAETAGIHLSDDDINRLVLRPRLVVAYVPPPFDLEHYKRHL